MGHETSVYQNNIKVKICNCSWNKSLELIKHQPKKFSNFAYILEIVKQRITFYYQINYFPVGPTVTRLIKRY